MWVEVGGVAVGSDACLVDEVGDGGPPGVGPRAEELEQEGLVLRQGKNGRVGVGALVYEPAAKEEGRSAREPKKIKFKVMTQESWQEQARGGGGQRTTLWEMGEPLKLLSR